MEILFEGAPERQALDRLRADRARIEGELDAISAAALSVDDAVSRVMTSLADARDRAAAYFTGFARPGSSPDPLGGTALLGVLLWLDQKTFDVQLRKRLKETLPTAGLPLQTRDTAIAKLRTRLTEIDELEERAICELESSGFLVDRRADVDLTMLLRVWDSI